MPNRLSSDKGKILAFQLRPEKAEEKTTKNACALTDTR